MAGEKWIALDLIPVLPIIVSYKSLVCLYFNLFINKMRTIIYSSSDLLVCLNKR